MAEELKITTIREKFQDEWVVVLVTQTDKYEVPTKGIVLLTSVLMDSSV